MSMTRRELLVGSMAFGAAFAGVGGAGRNIRGTTKKRERWVLMARKRILTTFVQCVVVLVAGSTYATPTLEEGFKNPPASAKPHTWYHMMNGNVTKEGITCDFEAIAKVGIGGVQMFDVGCSIPPGDLSFNTPEWFDMFLHAAKEARRLGLEICIPNCSGWSSSGGPWNMPSNGMKQVVFTETPAKGPAAFKAKLPRTENDNGFYEDIAVLAFPVPPVEMASFPGVKQTISGKTATVESADPFTVNGISFRLSYPSTWLAGASVKLETSTDGRIFTHLETFTEKLASQGICDYGLRYHPFAKPMTVRAMRLTFCTSHPMEIEELRPERRLRLTDVMAKTFGVRRGGRLVPDTTPFDSSQVVPREGTIDLTSRMSADGMLAWDVPPGDWMIMRVGYICNGKCNHPASANGKGLEVDKLSASAMDWHFSQYVERLCDLLGPLAGNVPSGFNNVLVDSFERASQNWTQGFDKTFKKRTGYSILPWLPVFTGRIVGSVDESERFLEDFRRVVADLFAENYSGRLAELCHRRGLKLSVEAYGNCPADNLQYGQDVDIPMGEFWSSAAVSDHATYIGNVKQAASLAHVWGRRYAAAEAFTAAAPDSGRWLVTPFSIKAQGDRAYAQGINRIIYHRFVHQPWPGNKYLPGMTMGRWGMHLDRTQTWWDISGDWFRYQMRCQWMLQEGVFAADVLYFCGEHAPNDGNFAFGPRAKDMHLPSGYAYDVCAAKAMEMLKVENGRVVAPGGVSYALLVLPPQETMSERMLSVVGRLVDAGAKVCSLVKPCRAPGLVGYPESDGRVRRLADRIWAKGVMACRPADALKRLGVEPDFVSDDDDPRTGAVYIHRMGNGNGIDWYFVALNNFKSKSFEASFRTAGRLPEIWDAEKGTIVDAPLWREENGRTIVTLDFPPSGSAFVVFRRPAPRDHVVRVDVAAERHPDPVAGKRHTLVIEEALYGAFTESGRMPVRHLLKPGREVEVSNATMGGDPARNQRKVLEVVYVLAGGTNTVRVAERKKFSIPAGAEIVSVWYGAKDPNWNPPKGLVRDIAPALSACVTNGSLSVVVDRHFAGGDPAPGQYKWARVTYVHDGVRNTLICRDGSELTIPAGRAEPDPMPDWGWCDGRILAAQPLSATLTDASGGTVRMAAEPPPPVAVKGAWTATFPVDWYIGGTNKKKVVFDALADWTSNDDPDIRYFSGTATYRKRIERGVLQRVRSADRVYLDFGEVRNFAVARVNGKQFPVLWRPPYRVDVTDLIGGSETLDVKVKVTNLWPNRLIGDDFLPEDCEWKGAKLVDTKEIYLTEIPQWVKEGRRSPTGRSTFTTWKHWPQDDQPLPSGLLGPVVLRPAAFALEERRKE